MLPDLHQCCHYESRIVSQEIKLHYCMPQHEDDDSTQPIDQQQHLQNGPTPSLLITYRSATYGSITNVQGKLKTTSSVSFESISSEF